MLATQIVESGRRTVWCQQHDALTLNRLRPAITRCRRKVAAESAELMMFLMEQPESSPEIVAAVDAAAAWIEETQIRNMAYAFD